MWRRALAQLVLTAAAVALTLVSLELALRCRSDVGTSLLVRDDVVGQRYLAGYAGERFVEEAGAVRHLRFNRLGFRGPEWVEPKPARVRRVALLGDSFTASIAVEEPETLAAQLERRLASEPGSGPWEVLNFGIGGFSTAQSLLTWRRFASRFEPDVVILCYYNGNDLQDNHRGLTSFPRPYFRLAEDGALIEAPISATGLSLSRWLNLNSHLYTWQKARMLELRSRFRSATSDAPPGMSLFDPEPPPPYPDAWSLTGALIRRLADEVHDAGARFVLVSIAAQEQIHDDSWQRVLDAAGSRRDAFVRDHPERMLELFAAGGGFPLIRLDRAFRAAADPHRLQLGGQHWSAEGNRLAAEVVYAELAPWLRGSGVGGRPRRTGARTGGG